MTVAAFAAYTAPLNPRLWVLIHIYFSARRLRNGRPDQDMPYWGNSSMPGRWCTAVQAYHGPQVKKPDRHRGRGLVLPPQPDRLVFLVQKTQEIANEAGGLGAARLAAYEKGDAESRYPTPAGGTPDKKG